MHSLRAPDSFLQEAWPSAGSPKPSTGSSAIQPTGAREKDRRRSRKKRHWLAATEEARASTHSSEH